MELDGKVDDSVVEVASSEVVVSSVMDGISDVVDGSGVGVSTGFGAVVGGTNVALPVNVVAKS